MSKLRVAILGAGMIGQVHRRASLLAGAEVVGVLTGTPDGTREVAKQWAVRPFGSIDDVVNADVDVVHICTPNKSHVPFAVAAMESGKHVICEKPLGLTVDEAQRAVEVAAATGKINAMPFAYRFHPMVREMRQRVSHGSFGPVNLIHGSYLQDWMLSPTATSWRVDPSLGGASRAFGDIGSHWCDLAEWVTGDRIDTLTATTSIAVPARPSATAASFSTPHDSRAPLLDVVTEDIAMILFRTRKGVSGSATISQVAAGRKNRLWLEVDGASSSAVFDQENPEHLWIGTEAGATILNRDPNFGSAEQRRLSDLPAGHSQGYAQCFEHFVADAYAAIQAKERGTEAPSGLPTFLDGLRAAQISKAMLHSAKTGEWVTVPTNR